ncbi:hypothetical protein SAMN05192539_104857 [Paraburkholderia diazotrophica]|uniref:Uncharacterized protein n=2 Tax=Paraburkholderia diazotrophica TaxID=667676 RepID=A0A1H7EJ04_9BURK|nr:hypothetical protein SAMN05192539_104857 [Paraburkholderia diazotrophica]
MRTVMHRIHIVNALIRDAMGTPIKLELETMASQRAKAH